MPLLNALELPAPRNWQDFEDLCCDLWRRVWSDPDAQKNGRSGQPQAGVDVFGRPNCGLEWAGLQCKLKSSLAGEELTQEEIEAEATKAQNFKPLLSSFIVATTGARDANAQEVARKLTARGPISVSVSSWSDIVEILAAHPDLVAKHFPQFRLTRLLYGKPLLAPPRHLRALDKLALDSESALESMRRNLDLLVVDLQVETDLFFDSSDIYSMILGSEDFLRHGLFDAHFWNQRTLVQCIATAGWYSPIRLLPAHQQELLRLLGREFERPMPRPQEFLEELRVFLKLSGILDFPQIWISASRELSSTELASFVRKYVGQAEGLFRVVQCIRDGDPRQRLLSFRSRHVVSAGDETNADLMHVLNTEEFHHLKYAFDSLRPRGQLRNFADAAAIVYLVLLIDEFDRGDTDHLPLFFASSPLFGQAIREAGVGQLLVSKRFEAAGSVLRDSEYFLLRAIFSPHGFIAEQLQNGSILERLRSDLATIIEASRRTSKGADAVLGTEVEALLKELREFSLFENVWLPAFAEETVVAELAEAIARLEDEQFRRAVRRSVEETKEALERGAKQYGLASLLWTSIQRAITGLNAPDDIDGLGKGLIQLGLSFSARSQAMEFLASFAEGGGIARSSMLSVIERCLNDPETTEDALQPALAVLWILRLDQEILEIVKDRRARRAALDPSTLMMESAASLRLGKSPGEVRPGGGG